MRYMNNEQRVSIDNEVSYLGGQIQDLEISSRSKCKNSLPKWTPNNNNARQSKSKQRSERMDLMIICFSWFQVHWVETSQKMSRQVQQSLNNIHERPMLYSVL